MAITSGSYTIGVGLDYDDLHDFADDFGTQTGNITGTISADEDVCDSSNATFDHSADGNTYTITVAEGNRFTSSTTWPANLEGVTDYARFVGSGATLIDLDEPGGIVEWLVLDGAKFEDQGGSIIRNCIIFDVSNSHGIQRGTSAGGTSYYHNIIMYNCRFGIWDQGTSDDPPFQCSYISMIPGSDAGIQSQDALTPCNGCAILGSGNCWVVFGSGSFTGDYNLSTQDPDAVMPDGGNSAVGITNSNYFENVGAGAENLHKKAAADGTYDGGPEVGLGTGWPGGDIDGSDARVDWDIGADEIPAAATPSPTPTETVTPTPTETVTPTPTETVTPTPTETVTPTPTETVTPTPSPSPTPTETVTPTPTETVTPTPSPSPTPTETVTPTPTETVTPTPTETVTPTPSPSPTPSETVTPTPTETVTPTPTETVTPTPSPSPTPTETVTPTPTETVTPTPTETVTPTPSPSPTPTETVTPTPTVATPTPTATPSPSPTPSPTPTPTAVTDPIILLKTYEPQLLSTTEFRTTLSVGTGLP